MKKNYLSYLFVEEDSIMNQITLLVIFCSLVALSCHGGLPVERTGEISLLFPIDITNIFILWNNTKLFFFEVLLVYRWYILKVSLRSKKIGRKNAIKHEKRDPPLDFLTTPNTPLKRIWPTPKWPPPPPPPGLPTTVHLWGSPLYFF